MKTYREIKYTEDWNLLQYNIHSIQGWCTAGVFLNSKLRFRNHVNYIFSHLFKLLNLVRCVTFSFSSLECYIYCI
jgi:hypothetical protein